MRTGGQRFTACRPLQDKIRRHQSVVSLLRQSFAGFLAEVFHAHCGFLAALLRVLDGHLAALGNANGKEQQKYIDR